MKSIIIAIALLCTVQANAQNYTPEWESLKEYETPEWFKDAKFGMWAHWGFQSNPQAGNWYTRNFYFQDLWQYNFHLQNYGNPKNYGVKELLRDWKAENWDPEGIVKLYKSVGAKYFFTLGNFHDNVDLWDSKYQEWNCVNLGPKKDVVGIWEKAARKEGLPFGVSFHAAHAWTYLEGSRKFDGLLKKEDGVGKWWEGYDPQKLYVQNHALSRDGDKSGTIYGQWDWGNGASQPDAEFKQTFVDRTLDAIEKYNPDLVYFDDNVLPFYYSDDEPGLEIASKFYNKMYQNGKDTGIMLCKGLNSQQQNCLTWDIERGIPSTIQKYYWQTCTCLGEWFYSKDRYNTNDYKSAQLVIQMLLDIVSKNGNMLLSVPLRGDGTPDDKELKILEDMKQWFDINGESVFGTRVWKTFGEGPIADKAQGGGSDFGFNEGTNYSNREVRYVQKNGTVYATIMAWPTETEFTFKAFSILSSTYSGKIKNVELLGYGKVDFTQDLHGLTVKIPKQQPSYIAPAFKIEFNDNSSSLEDDWDVMISSLEALIDEASSQVSNINTGKYTLDSYNALLEAIETAKLSNPTEGALKSLQEAWRTFEDSPKNKGGRLALNGIDITEKYLIEASDFSRADGVSATTRFSTPKYWTCENLNIPQKNTANGNKNGIDKYPGKSCLFLGIWTGEDIEPYTFDTRNSRLYRRVKLPAGKYCFACTYEALEGFGSKAYMFASESLTTTDEIPDKAIAYYPILQCEKTTTGYCGIYFSLEKESEVYLGWQVDFTDGVACQEFRAQNVALYDCSADYKTQFQALIQDVKKMIQNTDGKINDNTGFYTQQGVDALTLAYNDALEVTSDYYKAYVALSNAVSQFDAFGKNPGGIPRDDEGVEDLTIEKLIEANLFSRNEETSTLYSSPLHWTCENFSIPSADNGTKNGICGDCLMMGINNDKESNTSGFLSNARLYRKVQLKAGRYYFGATYQSLHGIGKSAYMFVSSSPLTSSMLTRRAIAYYPLRQCRRNDNQFYGLYFTLEEDAEVCLGWQMNLSSGGDEQEFMADAVRLLRYDKYDTAINDVTLDVNKNSSIYLTTGQRVNSPNARGLFIVNGRKVFVK